MSAMGQKRKWCHPASCPIFPSKQLRQREWHVRYVPTTDVNVYPAIAPLLTWFSEAACATGSTSATPRLEPRSGFGVAAHHILQQRREGMKVCLARRGLTPGEPAWFEARLRRLLTTALT